jgi:MFS family permease
MSISSDFKNAVSDPKAVLKNYFAQRVVYPWELPSIMRKHIYTGVMGSLYYNLIGGIFFIYFGNVLGMSRFEWGVMGAVSSFVLASQLLSAILTERLGRRKFIWFTSALLGRTMRIVGTLVALWLWRTGWPSPQLFLIAVVVASNFFDAIASPPWYSWLADIIPERQQGRFWGRRSAWIAFGIVCAVIPAGYLMDIAPGDWKMAAATGIFVVAGVLGIVDLFIHGTLPEPALVMPEQKEVASRLLAPLVDKEFRPWMVFNLCWTFGMTLGGALATLYFLDELGVKSNFLGGTIVLTALPLVGSIITGTWSGKLVDRIGTKPVLFWGHMFWGILPLFWMVSSPRSALWLLGISSVVGGTSSTAATTAANKIMTRLPAPEDRAMYVAVSSCLGSLAGGLGVLTAGWILELVGDRSWPIAGWPLTAFQIIFVSSLVLRLSCALFLIKPIKELNAESATTPAA